ncbi:MAG TPA: hypothetical protein VF975_04035 [Thermoanaerobaculia bacterium]
MDRETIRITAGKMLRSDDLAANEKEIATALVQANLEFGNPHIVRCDWCHETKMLFRDEDGAPFKRLHRGWRCETCNEPAASQEVKF